MYARNAHSVVMYRLLSQVNAKILCARSFVDEIIGFGRRKWIDFLTSL